MHKKHIFLRVFQKIALFACVFCAFLISPVFANLPAGYTELEYIESTGTQYIDTGVVPLIGDIFDVEYKYTTFPKSGAYQALFSAGTGNYQCILLGDSGGNYSTNSFYYKYFASGGAQRLFYASTVNSWNRLHITSSGVATIGDGISTSNPEQELDGNNTNLYIFKRRDGTLPFLGAIKKFIISRDAQVLNLVPVKRDSDNVVGMCDTVSGTFFENAGSGNFIAGPIAHCKTFGTDGVECIECETDYILNNSGGCSEKIKIATTKFVDDEFAAAEAKLATTVQTIESVVSRTIAQTGQILILQDTKQTRPDESCPANMKCLLVQDEDGTPHWYPIIEP